MGITLPVQNKGSSNDNENVTHTLLSSRTRTSTPESIQCYIQDTVLVGCLQGLSRCIRSPTSIIFIIY